MTEVAIRSPDGTLAYPPSVTIVGYHQDKEKHWMAELSCVISNTFVIGRRSLSDHGCQAKPGVPRRSDTP